MPFGIEGLAGGDGKLGDLPDQVFTSFGSEIELFEDESGGAKAPGTIPLLPNKKHVTTRDGREFTIDDPQALIERVRDDGIDLVVGRQHDEVWGVRSVAAGWIDHKTGLVRDGRYGIKAKVEWTDVGREFVESRHGRYISPVLDVPGMFEFLYLDGPVPSVAGIIAASVVNIPALRMPSLNSRQLARVRAGATPMNEEVRKRLCAAFGLPLDAKEETILAAAEAKEPKFVELTAEPDLTKWVPREEFDALAQRLSQVETVAASSRVDQAIAKHRKKIASPAYEKALRKQLSGGSLAFDAFEELMAATPESRLTTEDEAAGEQDKDTSTLGLTEAELEFCREHNKDPKDFAAIKARRKARRELRAI